LVGFVDDPPANELRANGEKSLQDWDLQFPNAAAEGESATVSGV
jgi:hypothetical protein